MLTLNLRAAIAICLLLVAAATTVLSTWASGQPVPLPDAPAGRLDCVSYAPPRFDVKARPPTRGEIMADLRVIATRFSCIRTYSTEGVELVPEVARAAGLRVMLGCWIGSDPKSNRREVDRLVTLANLNRDVIDALVVGNEVFLRRDLPVDKLRDLLLEVRNRTGLPVTTADIWAFWPQDPGLLDTVSFVLIHILPYWDDEPVSIDTVLPHVTEVYGNMVRKFPGKQVMIGETGWPTRGRPRGALEPGRINAARYVREFTAFAAANGLRYNLIEAFDQPWKRPNEGTVGGYWGLFDRQHQPKYPLQGPVEENPDWRSGLEFALAGGVLLPILGWLAHRRLSPAGAMLLALAGVSAGGVLLPQWGYLVASNRNWQDWSGMLAWTGAGWATAALALAAVLSHLELATAGIRLPDRYLERLRFGVLLGTAYAALGLVLAGRHRDFPLTLLVVPVVALVLLSIARPAADRPAPDAADTLLAAWIGLAAPLIVFIEGWRNSSALAFAALSVALAWTVLYALGPRHAGAGEDQGTGEDADRRELEPV